ncbi:MAG TPA: nucleolar RNA-binding Nop10p family protein [Candidatus Norongarragalinales archaeon]|nr:nucleolar RNA-binding Nop10p family protein [Candidatus Norongarragalinales archaeon]
MKLKKCVQCGVFTMLDEHCSSRTASAHPAKFSIADKYAAYRRKAKFGS